MRNSSSQIGRCIRRGKNLHPFRQPQYSLIPLNHRSYLVDEYRQARSRFVSSELERCALHHEIKSLQIFICARVFYGETFIAERRLEAVPLMIAERSKSQISRKFHFI